MDERDRGKGTVVSSSSVNHRTSGMRSNLYGNQSKPSVSESSEARGARMNTAEMEEQLQRENEAMLNALGNSVANMKSMAGNLQQDATEHNQLLKGLSDAFTTARNGVGSATTGLQGVMNRYGWKHTAIFGFALFLVLYLIYWAATR